MTSAVSGKGINIENLSNGSKGDYAYTIIELGVKVPEDVVKTIMEIPDVIKVRVIE